MNDNLRISHTRLHILVSGGELCFYLARAYSAAIAALARSWLTAPPITVSICPSCGIRGIGAACCAGPPEMPAFAALEKAGRYKHL